MSSPIGTGDYDLPDREDIDNIIFLEDEIEDITTTTDLMDDEDDVVKRFFGIK